MNTEAEAAIVQILEIVWINLLLSGDNAVVIALACRSLPDERRRLGILLGTCAAIVLRILFTLTIVTLLAEPFLKLAGAAALVWIAIQLLGEDKDHNHVDDAKTLWRAVRTIAVADAIMSLDNVIAIAAAANGSPWLIAFGLALSIPLIMFGVGAVTLVLDRFPILVWAGAALLGWIAGQLAIGDPALTRFPARVAEFGAYAAAAGAVLVVAVGLALRLARRSGRDRAAKDQ